MKKGMAFFYGTNIVSAITDKKTEPPPRQNRFFQMSCLNRDHIEESAYGV
jgi:hypothetical protein